VAGYSSTPLVKKLGFKDGFRVLVLGAPRDYRRWLHPLPENVTLSPRLRGKVDVVHLFTTEQRKLAKSLEGARAEEGGQGKKRRHRGRGA
jgi:hypothetical protein